MKKYMILAAAAAMTLASCAKFETSYFNEELENAPIQFSNYAPRAISKAAAANYAASTTLIADAQFKVWGWSVANGSSFNGSNGTNFMSWYTVTYKSGGDSNGESNAYPDGYRYWPSGDTPDKLSFYAYYPSNGSSVTATPSGLGAFSFTAAATAAAQEDFMIADMVKDQTYSATNSSTAGTVHLTFRHMLTRVQFKFKTTTDVIANNTTVTLTDVKLYNAKTTGTLTTAYNGTNFTTTWSNQGTPSATAYDVFVNGTDINNLPLTATAAPATNNAADIFLMVPQDMVTSGGTAPQYLVVNWDVTTAGVTTHNSKTLYFYNDLQDNSGNPFDSDGDTSGVQPLNWAKNASITYTLTIGPKPILFTAAVESWDAETNGYFNVQ